MSQSYKLYRGLQKPLVFKGLKGRYIFIGAGAGIGSLLVSILCSTMIGLAVGGIALFMCAGLSFFFIMRAQAKGLHDKSVGAGLYIIRKVVQGRLDV